MFPFLVFFLIISIILLTATLGLDTLLYYKNIYERIHIGRWSKRENWIRALAKINKKWLLKTPTVKLTDNDAYVIKDLLKGQYRSTTIQSWQEAGSLLGAVYSDGNEMAIQTFINTKIDATTGNWKTKPLYVDGAMLAYALSKTAKNTDIFKPAFDEIIALIERCKGEDGTIFYRDFIPSIRFVDTIGFICPFLTFYGQTYNKPEYIDLAVLQIKAYIRDGFLNVPFIPAHAYDTKSNNVPLGIYGWGRGLGWFILGLTDMYVELKEEHPEKGFLKELILKTAENTLPFQKENGSLNAMLAVASSRHDSSITTLAGWLFYTAYDISKEQEYHEASENCIKSLMKATRRSGAIDFCQGDTKGIGMYATTFDIMPFVQGLTIRLAHNLSNPIN